jgi:dTMP kinase
MGKTMLGIHSSRGALIVFEGCDRAGKSTQCKKLVQVLNERNIKAEYVGFPGKCSGMWLSRNKNEVQNCNI